MFGESEVFAQPSISSAPSSLGHGDFIVISGSGFGVNSAIGTSDLQWLGANIENGVNEAMFSPPTGWGNYYTTDTYEEVVAKYTNQEHHSGSKSIIFDYDKITYSRYKGHIYFDYASDQTKLYMTFWVKNHGGSDPGGGQEGQLKLWRFNQQASKTIPTGHMCVMHNAFLTQGNILELRTDYPNRADWYCGGCDNQDMGGGIYIGDNYSPTPGGIENRWVRIEAYVDVGTVGNADGTFQYYIHDPAGSITPKIRTSANSVFDGNLQYLYLGEPDTGFSHFLFGLAAVDGLDCEMYYDDVFTQAGTQARVELGDNQSWDLCTHREIQIPTAWSNNSITITANQGSFQDDDTAYLFVVDENGTVSNGYPITISTGSTGNIPPAGSDADNFILQQNNPNPFNTQTTINYQLPVKAHTILKIYNIFGQEIRTLTDENKSAGSHSVIWDGKNNTGQQVSSGIYFYNINIAGDFSETRNMLMIK
ncbi:MAG: T9SS type A sorting domain-containing protein [Bacteroidales bacterium]|nr:T9SS type A sorting domain-containing protein [Bacteroidales bacterium]